MCFWVCSVGGALLDTGEGLWQMADVKDAFDISVKQNFIDPLQNLQDKDLKEITVCCSKLPVNNKSDVHVFNSLILSCPIES